MPFHLKVIASGAKQSRLPRRLRLLAMTERENS